MNPRRGLKRAGLRTYIVEGTRNMLIDREAPRKFRIREAHWPPAFYAEQFRRLTDARAAAEFYARLEAPVPCRK